MNGKPTVIPGTLDGLLRRGSPVVSRSGRRGTVTHLGPLGWVVIEDEPHRFADDSDDACPPGHSAGTGPITESGWDLDATEITGQFHASLWMDGEAEAGRWDADYHGLNTALGDGHYDAAVGASQGDDDVDPEALRRVVLHIAGIES